jgi:hypothetical protein
MKLILAIGWFLIALPVEVDAQVEKMLIGDGIELTIQESPNHRGVPHFYYDQAMESIKHLYPESEVLVARRFGTLGEVVYSLVCYKEFKGSSKVIVGGMLAVGRRSWRFNGVVPVEGFTDSLVLILEAISKPPSNTYEAPLRQ